MWSSLTLGRPRNDRSQNRDDHLAHDDRKSKAALNKKLVRAATFCNDAGFKGQKTKTSWLQNVKLKLKKSRNQKSDKKCNDRNIRWDVRKKNAENDCSWFDNYESDPRSLKTGETEW